MSPPGEERDKHGRLYAAFDTALALGQLWHTQLLLNEEAFSASSGKLIHRVVARKS